MAHSRKPRRNPQEQAAAEFAEDVFRNAVRPLWGYRLEMCLVGLPSGAFYVLSGALGDLVAGALVLWLGGGVVAALRVRRSLERRLYVARVKRRWGRAVRFSGLATDDDRIPQAREVRPITSGDRLRVLVPRGTAVSELEARAEVIAATLGVRDVRVTRDEGNAAWASVVIVRHDPLAEPGSVEWPHLAAPLLSLWEPIPVGVDEDGQLVTVRLPERNVLIGGEPGAGKSVALSMLVATAALDPTVKLWVLDGKLVELAAWSGVAERSAGPDGEDTLDLLRGLRVEMEDRYAALLARGLRKVSAGDGLALHMVVCDELAFYLTLPDRKQRTEFAELMRDLVSRGRAAGIIVVAATQKPSADTVPTALRDLFGFRWALRCNTPQASDTILGQGWASLGYSAAQIAGAQRGVGYLLAEGGEPRRLRSCYLDDIAIGSIAARAIRLRSETAPSEIAA